MLISLESPDQADVIALISELDAYQDTLYPPESRHALDLTTIKQEDVLFAVVRDHEARALACCAIVISADFGELKRMYVRPESRGKGVGKHMLAFLEAQARSLACTRLVLETGPSQAEALGLYQRCGFEPCGKFGDYVDDPLSVFMHKSLKA